VHRVWPDIIKNKHFWAVVVLFTAGVVLQYPQQLHLTTAPSLFSFLGLSRHAFERILLFLPVGYTIVAFGIAAGFVSVAVAAVIMLPRVFLLSEYVPDALLETLGILIVGCAANLWFHQYKKEKDAWQMTASNLEAAYQQLENRASNEKRMQDQLALAFSRLNESHERLKESQEQLIQAEKLSSLGQLSASIAHEVNNPLSGILTYDQLLIRKTREGTLSPETALEYLRKMERELIRCTKLIRNLLDFARQSAPSFRDVNINEVMTRACDLASHAAQLQHMQVVMELDPKVPIVTADFDQLQQVCTNLILNAIQAMPENGVLTLRTLATVTEVMMQVSDTGYGISPDNMSRLFTPFFTTKREVKGVGLGLAVSYGIVQRHNGRIEVRSKLGEGTTMSVYLPLKIVGDITDNVPDKTPENCRPAEVLRG
jgi:signal transduction histidine kinase